MTELSPVDLPALSMELIASLQALALLLVFAFGSATIIAAIFFYRKGEPLNLASPSVRITCPKAPSADVSPQSDRKLASRTSINLHVKVTAFIHMVLGWLPFFGATMFLLPMIAVKSWFPDVLGKEMASIYLSWMRVYLHTPWPGDASALLAFLILLGGLIETFAAYSLLIHRRWARSILIFISCLHLLNIPFGALLGLYSLWVLLFLQRGKTLEHYLNLPSSLKPAP